MSSKTLQYHNGSLELDEEKAAYLQGEFADRTHQANLCQFLNVFIQYWLKELTCKTDKLADQYW